MEAPSSARTALRVASDPTPVWSVALGRTGREADERLQEDEAEPSRPDAMNLEQARHSLDRLVVSTVDPIVDAAAAKVSAPAPAPIAAPTIAAAGVLDVSTPEDPLEREADAAAERVVRRLGLAPGPGDDPDEPISPREAQQPAPTVQRASLVEVAAEATGLTPRLEAATGLVVDDEEGELSPGQMRKTAFLERLREVACETADRELAAAGRSAEGCPYIERILSRFSARPAAAVERAVRLYAPEAASATRAEDYFAPLSRRLAQGVAQWVETGQVPDDLPSGLQLPSAGGLMGAVFGLFGGFGAARAMRKATPNRTAIDVETLPARLGPGRAFEGRARARMERAFGHSFADVRIHDDADAAAVARSLQARAFTIGSHVAFAQGERRDGTPAGDALIAHELAHVVQQRGTSPLPPDERLESATTAPVAGLEREADDAAAEAVLGLWVPGLRRHRPQVATQTKPRLSRCGSSGARTPADLQRERCGYTPQQPGPVSQVPTGFEVEDTPGSLSRPTHMVYFERGSAVPDRFMITETVEILMGSTSVSSLRSRNVEIRGTRSADEPSELAQMRVTNVAELLIGYGHSGQRTLRPMPDARVDSFDFRGARMVEIVEAGQTGTLTQSSVAPCNESEFETARDRANVMLETAKTRLEGSLTTATTAAFEAAFGAPASPDRVQQMHDNLADLQAHLVGRMSDPDGHVCASMGDDACRQGATAKNHEMGNNAVMTLCPTFSQLPNNDARARVLIHEGGHAIPWRGAPHNPEPTGTTDFAYRWMRALDFLPAATAFENTDSMTRFVIAMQTPNGTVTPGMSANDPAHDTTNAAHSAQSPAQMDPTDAADTRRALAFVEQRVVGSFQMLRAIYQTTREAALDGARIVDPIWPALVHAFNGVTAGTLTDHADPPQLRDSYVVAGIMDRMRNAYNEFVPLDADPLQVGASGRLQPIELLKVGGNSTSWGSRRIRFGTDFFSASSHEEQVLILLRALLRQSQVDANWVPAYMQMIDTLRQRRRYPNAP